MKSLWQGLMAGRVGLRPSGLSWLELVREMGMKNPRHRTSPGGVWGDFAIRFFYMNLFLSRKIEYRHQKSSRCQQTISTKLCF